MRYRTFHYQAASWARPRHVIAKVEHHLGELFPRVGFIVTTLTGTNRAVVHFYNGRGTAEQWIKEGKAATHWTRLACHRFRANEVRLFLGVIAYNLGNLLRRLARPLATSRPSPPGTGFVTCATAASGIGPNKKSSNASPGCLAKSTRSSRPPEATRPRR